MLDQIGADPRPYLIPELIMNELLAVSRLPGAITSRVQEALTLVEALGMARVGNGHELLGTAAGLACDSGDDAVYVALAALTESVWLTADAKAAAKVRRKGLVRILVR